ncbi:UvrD-helicase domain-containing protein [Haloactinospora alba]
MLSVEISTIYKYGDYTRKVHHLCYMPDFAAAEEFNRRLGAIGNLGSDGRPILGLDSRDLLEIVLESGDGAYLVPAHIWTPWFAVLGSKAGFNTIEECYRDLSGHIFALETGLSSDPEMNWRISGLDGYTLVSHSDAHSPPMLGREASVFDTDVDYFAIRRALETGRGYAGSVEFFPEEGKYHLDGHRKCGTRLDPAETRAHGGRCPTCGKPVTVGVLNRVDALADRAAGVAPEGAAGYSNLIPLPEIVGEVLGVGPKSKKVRGEIDVLTAEHGPELAILDDVPVDDVRRRSEPLAEAIRRLRSGEVIRQAGYDGEYGTIRLFEPGELQRLRSWDVPALFGEEALPAGGPREEGSPPSAPPAAASAAEGYPAEVAVDTADPSADAGGDGGGGVLEGLDPDQRAAAGVAEGPLLIVAGPGTGKTRTVTYRIAHAVLERGVPAGECLAITFTRRAADEMAERLRGLVGAEADDVTVATFHSWGMWLLRSYRSRLGLPGEFEVADAARQESVLTEVLGDQRSARRWQAELSRFRRGGLAGDDAEVAEVAQGYVTALRSRGLVDYDDLIVLSVWLLENDPEVAAECRRRFRWITVDEYQDVDELQYRLLWVLAPADANVTVIGDPDQAIYGFRGADVGFFLRFERDYPTAPVVHLGRNYRSGRNIVAGALSAIAPETLVTDRVLVPERSDSAHRVGMHEAADERAEAAYVARTAEQLLGGASFHAMDSGRVDGDGHGGIGFSDIAVLYRTDAQSRAVVNELSRCGLPVQKRSHDPLVARAGVQELVQELTYASSAGSAAVIDRVHTAAEAIVERSGSGGYEQRSAEIYRAVEVVSPLARRFGTDVQGFCREVALGAEVDTLDPRADAISVLTLHAAKGLEFPVVFIVGCEDGVLPLWWPGSEVDPAELAEERRLFFVGMTRAQERLYLTWARRRNQRDRKASRFLSDVDPGVVAREEAPRRRGPRSTQLSLM